MEQRQVARILNLIGELVHRIGGQQQAIGPARLKALRAVDHDVGKLLPIARRLKLGDGPKIEAVHQ